ncbi:hypothetical protein L6452_35186 [Arctium lappa]|uniref:Uncharacterized protein n=1 Tax=Arctium lappa TaxID=4217 RepID=A0ACB8Y6J0_ARCLA|nr:hypothetical protein L6452_35186 [Arctium lappa]
MKQLLADFPSVFSQQMKHFSFFATFLYLNATSVLYPMKSLVACPCAVKSYLNIIACMPSLFAIPKDSISLFSTN